MTARVPLSRFWRLLRSRRLAVWLLLAIAGYSWFATLGTQRAFSSPLFLMLAGLLTASTAACAWERTRTAVRSWRSSGRVTVAAVHGLRERPMLALVPEAPARDAFDRLERHLRALGLRVRRGPVLLEAAGGRIGSFGSPLFHWSLVGLLVVVALGQLTRAEGMIGIPVGGERVEEAASYGTLDSGPLHFGHTRLRIAVEDFTLHHVSAEGFDHGPSPLVAVYDGERLLGREWVYPNSPLRQGRLLIHADEHGLASWVTLLSPGGEVLEEADLIADFDTASESGTTSSVLEFGPEGEPLRITLAPIAASEMREGDRYLRKELPGEPRLAVSVEDGSGRREAVVAEGGSFPLPDGFHLRFDRLTYYSRISVADDWSVPVIYALFALAALSLALSVFAPFRSVRVLSLDGGSRLHAEWRHSRRDAAFDESVREALRKAAEDLGAVIVDEAAGHAEETSTVSSNGNQGRAAAGSDAEESA